MIYTDTSSALPLSHTHILPPPFFFHKGVWRFFYQGNTKNLIGAEAWTKLLLQEDLCLSDVCMHVCMYTWMGGCIYPQLALSAH